MSRTISEIPSTESGRSFRTVGICSNVERKLLYTAITSSYSPARNPAESSFDNSCITDGGTSSRLFSYAFAIVYPRREKNSSPFFPYAKTVIESMGRATVP